MPIHYIYLLLAIIAETIATTALQASHQFSRMLPSAVAVIGFAVALYLLALTLEFMPVGIVYAIWSGFGIVLIAAIGLLVFGQKLDLAAVLGMSMILAGLLVIHLFSNTATH